MKCRSYTGVDIIENEHEAPFILDNIIDTILKFDQEFGNNTYMGDEIKSNEQEG